jgi:probable lipoprotein (TIGR04455 family)
MKLALLLFMSAAACSNVGHIYAAPGYKAQDPSAVKHITVAAWAPSTHAGAAPVIARVAADFVKLRKNYIVPESMALTRGWSDGCKDGRDGVLTIRVLQDDIEKSDVTLHLAAELYRCTDGALLWRAEGNDDAHSDDANLKEMVANYAQEFGADAAQFAAPAFVVLQDVLNALPDVVLTDAEVEEKIEQG